MDPAMNETDFKAQATQRDIIAMITAPPGWVRLNIAPDATHEAVAVYVRIDHIVAFAPSGPTMEIISSAGAAWKVRESYLSLVALFNLLGELHEVLTTGEDVAARVEVCARLGTVIKSPTDVDQIVDRLWALCRGLP